MSSDVSLNWWREHSHAFGVSVMDRTLARNSRWEEIVSNGKKEIEQALAVTGMTTGHGRKLLEIGCGMGRLTFPLSELFGQVVGIDVSPRLIAVGQSRIQEAGRDSVNIEFLLADGKTCLPNDRATFDTVFSYEVFHYIERATLAGYFHDAFRLLRPGGELVFEINTLPIGTRTKASLLFRRFLAKCGRRTWRGMPTDSGFDRIVHPVEQTQNQLRDAGFQIRRVIRSDPRQTWFVAEKVEPETLLAEVPSALKNER